MSAPAHLFPRRVSLAGCISLVRAAAELRVFIQGQLKPKGNSVTDTGCADGKVEGQTGRLEGCQGVRRVEVEAKHRLGWCERLPHRTNSACAGSAVCVSSCFCGCCWWCWQSQICLKVVWLPGIGRQG